MSVNGPFGLRPMSSPKPTSSPTSGAEPSEKPAAKRTKPFEQTIRRRRPPQEQPATERPKGWNLAPGFKSR